MRRVRIQRQIQCADTFSLFSRCYAVCARRCLSFAVHGKPARTMRHTDDDRKREGVKDDQEEGRDSGTTHLLLRQHLSNGILQYPFILTTENSTTSTSDASLAPAHVTSEQRRQCAAGLFIQIEPSFDSIAASTRPFRWSYEIELLSCSPPPRRQRSPLP